MAIRELELSFESLRDFKGGLVERMLAKSLNRVAQDLRTAADVPDRRTVTITFGFRPTHDDGELSDVLMEVSIGDKCPTRVTSGRLRVKTNGKGQKALYFNEDAPDSPDQHSLFEDGEREQRRPDDDA
jgi:hypothetical protein